MQEYSHKEVEKRISDMWEKGNYFTPVIDPSKKPFSMFLAPPNASGSMHIGNALMIAIQDILARYNRAKGRPTLWVPSTDHGGYETQVTFERELEKTGGDRSQYSRKELFKEIEGYVEKNSVLIKRQIRSMGASVDWSRFRYTMDSKSLESVDETFRKMVSDNLIYRRNYMLNYCPQCSTVLAGIELKEVKTTVPLYYIKFLVQDSQESVALGITRPEFIFSVTHVLVNPADARYAHLIGKKLTNPITDEPVEIIADTRKFDLEKESLKPALFPFCPSFKSYDYEYTLRNPLPARNLLDWNGNLIERYPGLKPAEAREKEIQLLTERGLIEKTDTSYQDVVHLCKRGHVVENIIVLTWFLKLDDPAKSLKRALFESARKDGLTVIPHWREKGLIEWIKKMHDWPIARQNVWGINIPIWYDISDPSMFDVWFIDKTGGRQHGNLKYFLDKQVSLNEITQGLERLYADDRVSWTLEKKPGIEYLPETDTFDTWFSSSQWAMIAFGYIHSPDFSYFYPSEVRVTGYDLIRLSVSRGLLLSQYITNQLPFKTVYLNQLIKGPDGQKMSKSLGNAVTLEHYLEKFGADVTRMALVSYTSTNEDFVFKDDRLEFFKGFSQKLLSMGQLVVIADQYSAEFSNSLQLSLKDAKLLETVEKLTQSVGLSIERYQFTQAQEKLCNFITNLSDFAADMNTQSNPYISLSVFRRVYEIYLTILHPCMPFMTEELYTSLYKSDTPLATAVWPSNKHK